MKINSIKIFSSIFIFTFLISGCSKDIVLQCDGIYADRIYTISNDLTRVEDDRGSVTYTYWKYLEIKDRGYITYKRLGQDGFVVYSYKDEKIATTNSMVALTPSSPSWNYCKK